MFCGVDVGKHGPACSSASPGPWVSLTQRMDTMRAITAACSGSHCPPAVCRGFSNEEVLVNLESV